MKGVDREKIVAKPGKFISGDIVQQLDSGARFEVSTTRVLDPGPASELKFACRPAWIEEVSFDPARDHVVERESRDRPITPEERHLSAATAALDAISALTYGKADPLASEVRARLDKYRAER